MYSMWVVCARLLGIGLTTIRRAVIRFMVLLRGYHRQSFFRYFTGGAHEEFLKNVNLIIIDRLNGGGRQPESFWQYRLETFAPQGLNIKQVEE